MNLRCTGLIVGSLFAVYARGMPGAVDPLALHPGPWADRAVIIRGDPDVSDLTRRGATVRSVLPGLCTVHGVRGNIHGLSNLPGIEYIEASIPLVPQLDIATSDSVVYPGMADRRYLGTAADGAQTAGWDGRETLVGIIDAGFDLDHPDFRDGSGSTRVRYLWDQTTSDNPPPPSYDYGSLWSGGEIHEGLCTQTGHIHGTRVLGIAAGNGAGLPDNRYAGAAPSSGLLLVKSTLMTAEIIDGLVWLTETAAALDQPLSVSLSLGSHYGAHDGSRGDEAAIDALSGPGRLFTCAAGNSDSFPVHDRGDIVAAGHRDTVPVIMNDYPQTGAEKGFGIDLWFEEGCSLTASIADPGDSTYESVSMGDSLLVDTQSGLIWIGNALDDPPNGDNHAVLLVTDGGTADSVARGQWELRLHWSTVSSPPASWHAWIFFRSHGACHFADPDSTCTIIMPATAESCIAAGAFMRDDGEAYPYSSRGPTRDGRMKPDLTAPTHVYTTELGGGYTRFSGTSAAAPHVAGAAALMLHRYPDASPGHVERRMTISARRDGAVLSDGSIPNIKWGHGKLYCEPLIRDFIITGIAVFADTTFQLGWEVSAGALQYEIYADTAAWFAPDTTGFSNRIDTVAASVDQDPDTPGIQWVDPAQDGTIVTGLRAYLVRAVKGAERWWSDNRSAGFGIDTYTGNAQ